MIVQHNLQAMNANRMLGITTGEASKSTEKLSSGYRINRAADDAAGLSISEKMRKHTNNVIRDAIRKRSALCFFGPCPLFPGPPFPEPFGPPFPPLLL